MNIDRVRAGTAQPIEVSEGGDWGVEGEDDNSVVPASWATSSTACSGSKTTRSTLRAMMHGSSATEMAVPESSDLRYSACDETAPWVSGVLDGITLSGAYTSQRGAIADVELDQRRLAIPPHVHPPAV